MAEKTIFDLSVPGRQGVSLPEPDVPVAGADRLLPGWARRKEPAALPELGEVDVVRHFVKLSTLNYHVDKGLYPLGSCTMKHNPKINEALARRPGFGGIHPQAPEEAVQGALRLMYELAGYLQEISGLHRVSLQPAAGAQGELTGMLIVRAYPGPSARQGDYPGQRPRYQPGQPGYRGLRAGGARLGPGWADRYRATGTADR